MSPRSPSLIRATAIRALPQAPLRRLALSVLFTIATTSYQTTCTVSERTPIKGTRQTYTTQHCCIPTHRHTQLTLRQKIDRKLRFCIDLKVVRSDSTTRLVSKRRKGLRSVHTRIALILMVFKVIIVRCQMFNSVNKRMLGVMTSCHWLVSRGDYLWYITCLSSTKISCRDANFNVLTPPSPFPPNEKCRKFTYVKSEFRPFSPRPPSLKWKT